MITRYIFALFFLTAFAFRGEAKPPASIPPSYLTSANWEFSGLRGPDPSLPTIYTTTAGASVTWKPAFPAPVKARVFFYKLVHVANNDPAVKLEIIAAGATQMRTINCDEGRSGWVEIGTYTFAGGPDELVRLKKTTPSVATRAAALRFDILDESGRVVVQNLTLDTLTDGPLVNPVMPLPLTYPDLTGHPAEADISALLARGVLTRAAGAGDAFAPDVPSDQGTVAVWIARFLRLVSSTSDIPPDIVERGTAASRLVKAGVPAQAGVKPVSGGDLLRLLAAAARATGKPLLLAPDGDKGDWLGMAAPQQASESLSRAETAVWLRSFCRVVIEPGPPPIPQSDGAWILAFRDEFSGNELDMTKWVAESGSPGHILSSRWPENVVVENGLLRLVTRKEQRGGREWTTGNISTRDFRSKFGYFEARIRVNSAGGLNNAFWLMNPKRPDDVPGQFEIDIVEAKYPNRAYFSVHSWSGEHSSISKLWTAPVDLSADFHVYAMDWSPQRLIFYVDGIERWRAERSIDTEAYPIRLSTAVASFAGIITDVLDGTSMDIDWVRVWQR